MHFFRASIANSISKMKIHLLRSVLSSLFKLDTTTIDLTEHISYEYECEIELEETSAQYFFYIEALT